MIDAVLVPVKYVCYCCAVCLGPFPSVLASVAFLGQSPAGLAVCWAQPLYRRRPTKENIYKYREFFLLKSRSVSL